MDTIQVVLTFSPSPRSEPYAVLWSIFDVDHSEPIDRGMIECLGHVPPLEGLRVALSAAWRRQRVHHR